MTAVANLWQFEGGLLLKTFLKDIRDVLLSQKYRNVEKNYHKADKQNVIKIIMRYFGSGSPAVVFLTFSYMNLYIFCKRYQFFPLIAKKVRTLCEKAFYIPTSQQNQKKYILNKTMV